MGRRQPAPANVKKPLCPIQVDIAITDRNRRRMGPSPRASTPLHGSAIARPERQRKGHRGTSRNRAPSLLGRLASHVVKNQGFSSYAIHARVAHFATRVCKTRYTSKTLYGITPFSRDPDLHAPYQMQRRWLPNRKTWPLRREVVIFSQEVWPYRGFRYRQKVVERRTLI